MLLFFVSKIFIIMFFVFFFVSEIYANITLVNIYKSVLRKYFHINVRTHIHTIFFPKRNTILRY